MCDRLNGAALQAQGLPSGSTDPCSAHSDETGVKPMSDCCREPELGSSDGEIRLFKETDINGDVDRLREVTAMPYSASSAGPEFGRYRWTWAAGLRARSALRRERRLWGRWSGKWVEPYTTKLSSSHARRWSSMLHRPVSPPPCGPWQSSSEHRPAGVRRAGRLITPAWSTREVP